jgi:hypothetical protein
MSRVHNDQNAYLIRLFGGNAVDAAPPVPKDKTPLYAAFFFCWSAQPS